MSNAAPKVRLAGTMPPPIGEALPAVWRLKVVMEILSVLMVATAGLLLAHFVAIVKKFVTER